MSAPSDRTRPRHTAGSAVAAIVGVGLRRLSRDRTSLFFLVALPLLVTLLIGLAMGGGDGSAEPRRLGVVAGDGAADLVAALEADPRLAVAPLTDRAGLEAALRRGEVAAGVVIDETVLTALTGSDAGGGRDGQAAELPFLAGTLNPELAMREAVREVLRSAEGGATDGGSLTVASSTLGGGSEATVPGGFAFTAPANLVLFVVLTTLVSGTLFCETRELGILERAGASPTPRAALLAGEAATRLTVALVQAGIILLAGALLFDVAWGDAFAVGAIVLLLALAATGAAMLLAVGLRTEARVTAAAPPIGIGLGMLGGTLWPLEIVGEPLRTLGYATPHAWAMEGLLRTGAAGAGVGDILLPLAVLAGFAVVLLGVAALVLSRQSLGRAV